MRWPVGGTSAPSTSSDNFNREVLHIEIDISITPARLIRIFEQL
jgi:hypothetical protein